MKNPLAELVRLADKTPVPYVSNQRRMPSLLSRGHGGDAALRAMGGVGTLFAIVDRYASATAQVEWGLWRRAASGKDEDRTEVTRHPSLVVLRRPNPFYSAEELIETVQQHIELVGEGCVVVVKDQMFGIPIELWPVRPDRLRPDPHPTEFISGYTYFGPDGERIPLETSEVIRFKRPCPWDPYHGLGAVQTILVDLKSVEYAAEWNKRFFENDASPGGIIEYDEELEDTEFKRMRMRWQEQHQGISNAHRVAIIEKGKWRDRSYSMRDMQFAELRNVSREVIREAFRAHKHMLGLADDVNKANAQAAETTFGRWEVLPRLKRWKTKLNGEFLPLFRDNSRYGIELDHENPVPDDRELESQELTAQANAAKALVDAGYDRAGVLEAVGLPEIEAAAQPPAPAAEPASSRNGNGHVPEEVLAGWLSRG